MGCATLRTDQQNHIQSVIGSMMTKKRALSSMRSIQDRSVFPTFSIVCSLAIVFTTS